MGRFYGIKILNGDMTIEDVPRLWREKAQLWILESEIEHAND